MVKLWREFWQNPWLPKFTVPLIIINVLGSIYGYYWYSGQLAVTPRAYWLFVPDSPLSTTLFALALLFSLWGRRGELFRVLAMAACIKYGIWAVLVIAGFWHSGGPVQLTEMLLFLSHLGMVAEGLIYLAALKWGRLTALLLTGWMLLNDFMDYVVGLHPYLFLPQQWSFALLSAVGLSFIISLGLILGCRRL